MITNFSVNLRLELYCVGCSAPEAIQQSTGDGSEFAQAKTVSREGSVLLSLCKLFM